MLKFATLNNAFNQNIINQRQTASHRNTENNHQLFHTTVFSGGMQLVQVTSSLCRMFWPTTSALYEEGLFCGQLVTNTTETIFMGWQLWAFLLWIHLLVQLNVEKYSTEVTFCVRLVSEKTLIWFGTISDPLLRCNPAAFSLIPVRFLL